MKCPTQSRNYKYFLTFFQFRHIFSNFTERWAGTFIAKKYREGTSFKYIFLFNNNTIKTLSQLEAPLTCFTTQGHWLAFHKNETSMYYCNKY